MRIKNFFQKMIFSTAVLSVICSSPALFAAETQVAKENKQDDKKAEKVTAKFSRQPDAVVSALKKRASENKLSTSERIQEIVALGKWDELRSELEKMPDEQAGEYFKKILGDLQKEIEGTQKNKSLKLMFSQADFIGLTDACPGKPNIFKKEITDILKAFLDVTNDRDTLLRRIEAGTRIFGGTEDQDKRNFTADVFFAAGLKAEGQQYLPDIETCKANKDLPTLLKHIDALADKASNTRDPKIAMQAWDIQQWILRNNLGDGSLRESALSSTLNMLPHLPQGSGRQWIRDRFSDNPEVARDALVRIGNIALSQLGSQQTNSRRDNLKTIRMTVEGLLENKKDNLDPWKPSLTLLAWLWSTEAEKTIEVEQAGRKNRQRYGNRSTHPQSRIQQRKQALERELNQKKALDFDVLQETAPTPEWRQNIDPQVALDVQAKLLDIDLFLMNFDPAIQHLEVVAKAQPEKAKALCAAFLERWQQYADSIKMDEQSASAIQRGYSMSPIPLTRAMQNRNLQNLKKYVEIMRQLPGSVLEDKDVIGPFISAHSDAEVFKVEDIENVMGPVENLSDDCLITLAGQMQSKLSGAWRKEEVQQQYGTNRTENELEMEVQKGYELVIELLENALPGHQDDHQFLAAMAATTLDYAEYQYSIDSQLEDYVSNREKAFDYYKKSVQAYIGKIDELKPFEYSAMPFINWYVAILGASDVSHLNTQQEYSYERIEEIHDTIAALDKPVANAHFKLLGDLLVNFFPRVPAHVKIRYLETATTMLGDHPAAKDLNEIVDGYKELLDEIQLVAEVDGDKRVGHDADFGVKLKIRHTLQVDRESAGLARFFSKGGDARFNRNARDNSKKFIKNINEALDENFEVKYVSIADATTDARPADGDWYETPAAYVLLSARDAKVDRIPSIQLDLLFEEPTGRVVIPIESSMVMINAREKAPLSDKIKGLSVTQVVDEREMENGQVLLEITATSNEMLPDFDTLFKADWGILERRDISDPGQQVTKLDTSENNFEPTIQRSWMIDLALPAESTAKDVVFEFPAVLSQADEVIYKRYNDADLETVGPKIALHVPRQQMATVAVVLYTIGTILVIAIIAAAIYFLRKFSGGPVDEEHDYHLPPQPTPFAITHLLRRIQSDASLSLTDEHRRELVTEISNIEQACFAPDAQGADVNLESLARKWVRQARAHKA